MPIKHDILFHELFQDKIHLFLLFSSNRNVFFFIPGKRANISVFSLYSLSEFLPVPSLVLQKNLERLLIFFPLLMLS
jgi:hypothetical protein